MSSAATILSPMHDETETARKELRNELAKSEQQPLAEKRDADEVFAEKRRKLEVLLNAGV
jgi:hypothetical protein